jgi:WD40 repeat protein
VEIRVFISYAHEDESWLRETDALGKDNPKCLLKRWQRTLETQGWGGDRKASFWYDQEKDASLRGGQLWKTRIVQEVDRAHVAVLLVTEAFVASPLVRGTELPRILERSQDGEIELVPILIEPADYANLGIDPAQFTPGKPTPLATLLAESESAGKNALLEITQALVWALERALEKAKAPRPPAPAAAPSLPKAPSTPQPPSVAPPRPKQRSILRWWPIWAGAGGLALAAAMVFLLSRLPESPPSRPSAEPKTPAARLPSPEPVAGNTLPERPGAPDAAPVVPEGNRLFSADSGAKFVGAGGAFAVAFSADGRLLAGLFAGSTPEIGTWDLETRQPASRCSLSYLATRVGTFSPDGKRALVADSGARGRARRGAGLVDVETCRELKHFDTAAEVRGVAFSPDGDAVYLTGRRFVELWALDGTTAKAQHDFPALRDDGNLIAVGRKVVVLDGDLPSRTPNQGPPAIAAWNDSLTREAWRVQEGADFQSTSLAVSPNGRLVLAGQSGRAVVAGMSSGRTEALLTCPAGSLRAVAFSPDGSLAAAGGDDFALCLWNVEKRQLLGISKTTRLDVQGIAFSSDGRRLAVAADHLFAFPVPR